MAVVAAAGFACDAMAQGASSTLTLSLSTDRGRAPIYRRGDALVIKVTPSRDAHVYCFYRLHDGQVTRLFPNRYRTMSLIAGGQTVTVPDPTMKFRITFDAAPSLEQVDCYATGADPKTKIAADKLGQDLTPTKSLSLSGIRATFAGAGFATLVVDNIVLAIAD